MTEKLFEKGLLKKAPGASTRVPKSLRIAAIYLGEARLSLKAEAFHMCLVAAYTCIFHSARAFLFADGIAERSHFAVYEYLKEKHAELGRRMLEGLNIFRQMRHAALYELDAVVAEDDAKSAIEFAAEFLEEAKKKLGDIGS